MNVVCKVRPALKIIIAVIFKNYRDSGLLLILLVASMALAHMLIILFLDI
jgi:hypothetical protein